MPAPELPDWCLEEEEGNSDNEDVNGERFEDGTRPDGKRKRFRRDPRLKVDFVCQWHSVQLFLSKLKTNLYPNVMITVRLSTSNFLVPI